MDTFYQRLSYSFGNEDWRTEHKALNIQPLDKVLCITASGDRPLHLLLSDCSQLLSVDLNPIQNHLLHLKMTALKYLDYSSYMQLLGAESCSDRIALFYHLAPRLETTSRAFWLNHLNWIEKGVLYQGAVESMLKKTAQFLKLLRGKKIKKLFSIDNLEEQRQFVKQEWDTHWWKRIFQILDSSIFAKYILKDPGLYAFIPSHVKVGNYFYQRMNDSLHRHLAKDNYFLSMILQGHVNKTMFPPYLTPAGTEKIKKNIDKIEVHNSDVISFLGTLPNESINVFSLSDVASYVNQATFARLLHEIYRTAKNNARFSVRQFLSFHQIPTELNKHLQRNENLEKELEKDDRCFVYKYMVGSVQK